MPPLDRREKTNDKQGRAEWEELARSEAFQNWLREKYPDQAGIWPDTLSRRKFLTLMGASLALAGLNGCSVKPAPSVDLVPYVNQPEELTPGRPLFYATTMTFAGAATGLLVESHEGRPTKIEGNPNHPASLGATGIFEQAAVLTLYDPDRAQTATYLGQTRTWEEALDVIGESTTKLLGNRGAGLRFLTEGINSPTLGRQMRDFLTDFPEARWHVYEPIHRDAARQGARMAFGADVDAVYDFTKADVVLALDDDFLQCGPGTLRYAADFMAARRAQIARNDAPARMNRLYVAETAVSCTGVKADHRLAVCYPEIALVAREIAAKLGVGAKSGAANVPDDLRDKWASAVAKDLDAHRGRCLVLAGGRQPPEVHLLAHLLNDRLGNVGQTVNYIVPIDAKPESRVQSLRELAQDMERGRVELLVILGGNPVYAAPADLDFSKHLKKVPLRVHHSLYLNETSYQCHWHLPESHFLEAWSDARAFDGTASIVQPLIEPLYRGRSAHELIALLANRPETSGLEIVRGYWRADLEEKDKDRAFAPFWEKALHDGVISDSKFPPKAVKIADDWEKFLPAQSKTPANDKQHEAAAAGENLEIVFQADPTVYDGSWANNAWLQELPKPITKLTWGNAAIMSSATARQLGIEMGGYAHGGEHGGYYMPVVKLQSDGREVRAPAWIMPGHADSTITFYLGNGREWAGKLGGDNQRAVGCNAYLLRTADKPWFSPGVRVKKTGATELVACTQAHQSMEDRDPVRSATIAESQTRSQRGAAADRDASPEENPEQSKSMTMYEPFDYSPPKHKWGMTIDLTACVGCHACVVACQAENNIAVVGKAQVACGREMHWLRIDRYADGPAENPARFHFQPVPCMHCENAPCEYVCPVEATVHSADGLNEMLYQRCVGTRFCSNNCPYKVRRFNFFFYSDYQTPSRRLQYNPEVTVRSRGVMEKCSYCVQRLRRAEIDAEMEERRVADGEVLTACQAVCPTKAITFGDMNDPQSAVKRQKDSPLNYALLDDLNTNPRTTYLIEVRNPNPKLETTQDG